MTNNLMNIVYKEEGALENFGNYKKGEEALGELAFTVGAFSVSIGSFLLAYYLGRESDSMTMFTYLRDFLVYKDQNILEFIIHPISYLAYFWGFAGLTLLSDRFFDRFFSGTGHCSSH